MDGQPFFVVHQDVDPGLIKVLEADIIPRLSQDIPGQPRAEDLVADPRLHRFTVVFDREGLTSRIHDAAVTHLCKELNDTETVYPGTNLRMAYELVSSRIPGSKEF